MTPIPVAAGEGRNKAGRSPRILVVDDDEVIQEAFRGFLATLNCELTLARGGVDLPGLFGKHNFDLAFIELRPHGKKSMDFCRWIKYDPRYRDCVVIFLTSGKCMGRLGEAFDAGAHDYLLKPVKREDLLAHAKAALKFKKGLEEVHRSHAETEAALFTLKTKHGELAKAYSELKNVQRAVLFSLAKLTESRDLETGKHLVRVQQYMELLARTLQKKERYSGFITEQYIESLTLSAPLHDIGKVAIPDQILLKPGKLSESEYELMKQHVEIGARTLEDAARSFSHSSFLDMAIMVSRYHHERNDGHGYLKGLSGDDIPLSARMMSLVDHYDAMRNDRVYKKAFSHAEASRVLLEERGIAYFHPDVLEAFKVNEAAFRRISTSLRD